MYVGVPVCVNHSATFTTKLLQIEHVSQCIREGNEIRRRGYDHWSSVCPSGQHWTTAGEKMASQHKSAYPVHNLTPLGPVCGGITIVMVTVS